MFFFTVLTLCFENDNPLRLWYTQPASKLPYSSIKLPNWTNLIPNYDDHWQQNSLPIGNGFIGANVFGEIQNERLTFNEMTLWEGGPSTKRPNYNGGNNVNKGKYGETFRNIQKLFSDGKDSEASTMCDQLVGDSDGYGSYIEFGEINLELDLKESDTSNYVRWLDLDQAITYVQYDYKGATITREYFVSYPDNVLVIHLNTTKDTLPTTKVTFKTQAASTNTIKAAEDRISFEGTLTDNQMIFNFKLAAQAGQSGSISTSGNSLVISNSNDIFIFASAATDYKDIHPKYRTGETQEEVGKRVLKVVNDAVLKGFEKVRNDHLKDYTNLFSRVSLDLKQKPSKYPTNEQLSNYKKGKGEADQDRDLEVLLFQYGRYLTIGSSREKGLLPANLQGIWNNMVTGVPWSSDYHMNINLQMNYWPTYVTNLHECAFPLMNYIEGLRIPGRITAEIYSGIKSNSTNPENGFMAHTQNTPFGWTCPGWAFSWGWSPAAVLWILQNVFDYYLFTGDEETLRNKIYPMMKEEATLYDQIMVYNKEYDRLVSSPTYSPEQGPRTNGNAYEQELIWQHYHNTIRAAQVLKVDSDLIPKWNNTLNQLKPIEIGESGQIKEWYSETYLGSIGEKGHRHMSHLLGLYPGDLISVDNKEWMDAAIVSLIDRGDKTTGWGMGQRINAWSRTGDGEHAYTLVKSLLTNGIYNNLWDYHPPFQIDGNFGATSGIAEMLLQSNRGYINILPTIPAIWGSGNYDGLVARGNVVVGVTWENGAAKEVRLKPAYSGDLTVECKGITSSKIVNEKGESIPYSVIGENRVIFTGVAGGSYTISQMNSRRSIRRRNRTKIIQIV
ncbi:hypothetical protein M9Y10_018427 [Tritrichomonas musculus]|uniref:Glycosyl hydrolase family 95 N-terminal domain-containing protein n=1 Tax=Tritrichomonas musculus TaxID=1915356 RepID=A0ABR2HQ07_9EUKA